jgi:hypothetical protein
VLGAAHWPELRVDFQLARAARSGEITHPAPGGLVCFDPRFGRALVPRPQGSRSEELLHPGLTIAGFLAARVRGDEAIHAGACAHAGGAWIVLGDHEQGKSTMLALLARLGCEPLTDDLTVIRDGNVCAGARCLDLRPAAAAHLGVGEPSRLNTRRRMNLPPAQAEHPLRGFLHLNWSSRIGLRLLPARERMVRLIEQIGHFARPEPARLLEFAALPHYELSRPQDWDSADRGARLVQEAMAAASVKS